jgi:hypothetical protein
MEGLSKSSRAKKLPRFQIFMWKASDNCARSTRESVHRFLQAATVARAIMLRYELKSRDKYEK